MALTTLRIFSIVVVIFLLGISIPSAAAYSSINSASNRSEVARSSGFSSMSPATYTETLTVDSFSGYLINSSAVSVSFTAVSVSFVIPKASCNKTELGEYGSQYIAIGVFSDGWDSNDYAGADVVAHCFLSSAKPTIVWLAEEFSTANGSAATSKWSPAPGDHVTMNLTENSGVYELSVLDSTQSTYLDSKATAVGARLDSVSCGADMLGNSTTAFPTVKFSKVHFKDCRAGAPGLKATPIGSNPAGGTVFELFTVNNVYTKVLTYPLQLFHNEDFVVGWNNYGP